MKNLVILTSIALGLSQAWADKIDLTKDFDSLGGNQAVAEKARALSGQNKTSVVQHRLVSRNMRLEIGGDLGLVGGGDSYYSTQNLGAHLDFHITPKWSVGARYYRAFNDLNNEGRTFYENGQVQQAKQNGFRIPGIDFPIETYLATLAWYPIYGKLNLFDAAVSHFDLYTLIGYGKTNLNTGTSDTYTTGGGVGIWLNQHFAMRLEGRYQTYQDNLDMGGRHIDAVIGTVSFGVLL